MNFGFVGACNFLDTVMQSKLALRYYYSLKCVCPLKDEWIKVDKDKKFDDPSTFSIYHVYPIETALPGEKVEEKKENKREKDPLVLKTLFYFHGGAMIFGDPRILAVSIGDFFIFFFNISRTFCSYTTHQTLLSFFPRT